MQTLSFENQFEGKICDISDGAVNTVVKLQFSTGEIISSLVDAASFRRLGLAVGDRVTACFKSNDVMIGVGDGRRNVEGFALHGDIASISTGAVNGRIAIETDNGLTVTSQLTMDAVQELGLRPGSTCFAFVRDRDVVLAVPMTQSSSEELVFSYYPKDQVDFRCMGVTRRTVKEIRIEQDQIMLVADEVAIAARLFSYITPPSIMAALKVVSYGAGFVGIIAQNVKLSIDEFRDETIFNVKADWRWIETDKLPYKMELHQACWFSFRGERISGIEVSTRRVIFDRGEIRYE